MSDQLRPTQVPINHLVDTCLEASATLMLAVLDDIAAHVRLAHPDAGHLEISLTENGDPKLHAIWSTDASGGGSSHLLRDHESASTSDPQSGPVDWEELLYYLEQALTGPQLYRWGLLEPHPDPERRHLRRLTLPPADRAAAVAALVRRHVPDAASLICYFSTRQGMTATGFEQVTRTGGHPIAIPCSLCSPDPYSGPWPLTVSHELAALLAQLYALPHLRSRHLTPCVGDTSDHGQPLWQLTLPYATPAATTVC